MKIFRHIAGIVLGAFGLVIMLGAGVLIFDAVHRVSLGIAVLIFVLLGLLPFAGAFVLLRSTLAAPGNSCPQCGGTEHVTAGVLRHARSWWLFYISDGSLQLYGEPAVSNRFAVCNVTPDISPPRPAPVSLGRCFGCFC